MELKADKEQMLSLAQQVMACRPPASSYALLLHEKFILFCLENIKKDVSHEIEDSEQFLRILRIHDIVTQHLMYELYLHGYFLRDDKEFNLVPYVGDIHLRALTSYTLLRALKSGQQQGGYPPGPEPGWRLLARLV